MNRSIVLLFSFYAIFQYLSAVAVPIRPLAQEHVVVGNADYSLGIQICTHLGCIPSYDSNTTEFHCACHGGRFDACGRNIFGPPPTPMAIPPFKIDGDKLVLGEEGPEYLKLVGKA